MSLTHKALNAMGIEPEKIEQILEMHRETLDSIKADKDKAVEERSTKLMLTGLQRSKRSSTITKPRKASPMSTRRNMTRSRRSMRPIKAR